MTSCDQPLIQDEEQARERLARRLERYGMAVAESFRGDALIAASQIFGLGPDRVNESLGEAAGPDPLRQTGVTE